MSAYDPDDPLFRPLTIGDVMNRTGRSRKTVDRWIKSGRLQPVALDDPKLFVERDVVELEQQMRTAVKASRDAIAARGGRPGARPPRSLGTAT